MKSTQFISTTDKYGKEVFRRTLADYITNEKPPFPLKEFSQDKVVREFHKLKTHDWTDWISKRSKDDVIEKNEGAINDWHERHHDSKLEEFCDNHPDAFECRVYDE